MKQENVRNVESCNPNPTVRGEVVEERGVHLLCRKIGRLKEKRVRV